MSAAVMGVRRQLHVHGRGVGCRTGVLPTAPACDTAAGELQHARCASCSAGADGTQCGSGTAACFVRTPSAVLVCMCMRCVRAASVFECGAHVSPSPQALGADWHHQQQSYAPLFSIILRSDVMHFFILISASNIKIVFNINFDFTISFKNKK